MKMSLPFAYALSYRLKYGRIDHRAVYRSEVEVELQSFDTADFELVLPEPEMVTYAKGGRLFRPLTFYDEPMTPDDLRWVLLGLDEEDGDSNNRPCQGWAMMDDVLWSKHDFPRPRFMRCFAYSDRSAVYWPPQPDVGNPLWKKIAKHNSERAQAEARSREAYREELVIVDGEVWAAAPEPVWVLRQSDDHQWHLVVARQPTVSEAALSFSIRNYYKAQEFADLLALDIETMEEPVEIGRAFPFNRADLTALASATIALSRDQVLPLEPDECVFGAACLPLVEKALLSAGGSEEFPFERASGRFAPGVNATYMRRRWQYELQQPEHRPFFEAIWSEDDEIRQRAKAEIALRTLADVDPDVEASFAAL